MATTLLIEAVKSGHRKTIARLLFYGADPFKRDGFGVSAFFWATPNCHAMLMLLQESEDWGLKDRLVQHLNEPLPQCKSGSLVGVAVDFGYARTLEMLLQHGAGAGTLGEGDHLYRAVQRNDLRAVELLLGSISRAEGTTSPAPPPSSDTPVGLDLGLFLVLAASLGHIEIAKLLVEGWAVPSDRLCRGATPLAAAAQGGQVEVASWLLEQCKACAHGGGSSSPPITCAAAGGHIGVMRLLLKHRANVRQTDASGTTALVRAAEGGHHELVKVIMEHSGSRLNPTELALAARAAARGGTREHVSVIAAIGGIQNHRSLRAADGSGRTPAHVAAEAGHPGALQKIIELCGATVLDVQDAQKNTPMGLAASKGHSKVLEACREHMSDTRLYEWITYAAHAGQKGALEAPREAGVQFKDASFQDHATRDAALLASRHGHAEALAALLANGADKDQTDTGGSTLAFIAAACGHAEVLRVLVGAGANLETPIDRGWRSQSDVCPALGLDPRLGYDSGPMISTFGVLAKPGHMAAVGGHVDALRVLVEETDLYVDLIDGGGATPAFAAAATGMTEALLLLLDNGAGVDKQDFAGAAPLFAAAAHGHRDAVELLLDRRADLNQPNADGITPTCVAARCEDAGALQVLLDRGADPNKANNQGVSPVLVATATKRHDAIRMLVAKGADPNQLGESPRKSFHHGVQLVLSYTPLMLALERGDLATAKVLLEVGADPNKATGLMPDHRLPAEHLIAQKEAIAKGRDGYPGEISLLLVRPREGLQGPSCLQMLLLMLRAGACTREHWACLQSNEWQQYYAAGDREMLSRYMEFATRHFDVPRLFIHADDDKEVNKRAFFLKKVWPLSVRRAMCTALTCLKASEPGGSAHHTALGRVFKGGHEDVWRYMLGFAADRRDHLSCAGVRFPRAKAGTAAGKAAGAAAGKAAEAAAGTGVGKGAGTGVGATACQGGGHDGFFY